METHLLTREDAEKIFLPHYEKFVTTITGAFETFQKFNQISGRNNSFIDLKHRATYIHDIVCSDLEDEFPEGAEMIAGVYNKMFGIYVPGIAFVRFKKLNKNLYPSNTMTRQQQRVSRHLALPGFEDKITYVTLGYLPNSTWTSVDGIFLVCWLGEQNLWHIDLTSNIAVEQTTFLTGTSEPTHVTVIISRVSKKTGTDEIRKAE